MSEHGSPSSSASDEPGPPGPDGRIAHAGAPAGQPRAEPAPPESPSGAAPLPWYHEGIRFGCTGCGACCRQQGYVWLGAIDVIRMATYLGLSIPDFRARYTRDVPVPGQPQPGVSLRFLPHGCVFLEDATNRCTVYDVRPLQCRAFPFWPHTVASKEMWDLKVRALCGEEAFVEGKVYGAEEIRATAGQFVSLGPAPAGGAKGGR